MIFASLILAATTYQSILGRMDEPLFESGASKYEFYADGDAGEGRRVVVYGFVPVRRGSSPDFDHRVFVTLVRRKGDGYEAISSRRDLTDSVFNIGERGRFMEIRAKVNAFTLVRGKYVDVTLWSSISGSGGISAASDVILRIARDNELIIAAKLDETEAHSRSGWRETHQISSELAVGDGALQWTKKERLAFRDNAGKPYKVNCQTTRTTYRPLRQGISPSEKPPKGKLTPLERLPLASVVPCCSGCELKE